MATLTLVTPTNRTIVSVRKPVSVLNGSHELRLIFHLQALVLPPSTSLMSYFWEQPGTVHLTVPLVSNIETGTSTVIANVELGRRDQWKSIGNGEGRELSVSAAFLRGVVVHQGLRYVFRIMLLFERGLTCPSYRGLLTRFPLATALSASGTFLFISCLILASCLLPMIELRLPDDSETIEAAQTETPPPAPKREESSSRRGRRSRSSTVPRRRSRSVSCISCVFLEKMCLNVLMHDVSSRKLNPRTSQLRRSNQRKLQPQFLLLRVPPHLYAEDGLDHHHGQILTIKHLHLRLHIPSRLQ